MCRRRQAEVPRRCLAPANYHKPGKPITGSQNSKGKEPAMTARESRSPPTPTSPVLHQLSHDARLSQINGEVLHNADVPPPAYEEVVVSNRQPQSREVHSSAAQSQPRPFAKVERDLQYYSNERQGQAASSSPNRNFPQEKRPAALEDVEDFSDAESFDSDWDNETIAGINTPATTVYGDDDYKHSAQRDDKDSLSREISDSSPSLLEYIRAQNGLPNVGTWSREDWKAAKAAFKAERREAKAAFKAERRNLKAAWKAERRENKRASREERREDKEVRREDREIRRAEIREAS